MIFSFLLMLIIPQCFFEISSFLSASSKSLHSIVLLRDLFIPYCYFSISSFHRATSRSLLILTPLSTIFFKITFYGATSKSFVLLTPLSIIFSSFELASLVCFFIYCSKFSSLIFERFKTIIYSNRKLTIIRMTNTSCPHITPVFKSVYWLL